MVIALPHIHSCSACKKTAERRLSSPLLERRREELQGSSPPDSSEAALTTAALQVHAGSSTSEVLIQRQLTEREAGVARGELDLRARLLEAREAELNQRDLALSALQTEQLRVERSDAEIAARSAFNATSRAAELKTLQRRQREDRGRARREERGESESQGMVVGELGSLSAAASSSQVAAVSELGDPGPQAAGAAAAAQAAAYLRRERAQEERERLLRRQEAEEQERSQRLVEEQQAQEARNRRHVGLGVGLLPSATESTPIHSNSHKFFNDPRRCSLSRSDAEEKRLQAAKKKVGKYIHVLLIVVHVCTSSCYIVVTHLF